MSGFMYNDSINQTESHLILYIEEVDNDMALTPVDTALFVGWDECVCKYFIRGRRQDNTATSNYVPYSFYCHSKCDLYKFIRIIFEDNAKINYTLYNFNNVATYSQEELSYEFFERHRDKDYELVGYDNATFNKTTLYNLFDVIKNIYN